MAKNAPPEQFPVTIEEFLDGMPKGQIETRRAFAGLVKDGQRRSREEWMELYALFQTKPAGVPWDEWRSKNGR